MGLAGKAAIVVLDGFGLDPEKEWGIVSSLWKRLAEEVRKTILGAVPDEKIAVAALAPTSHGVARWLAKASGNDWLETVGAVQAARVAALDALTMAGFRDPVTEGRIAEARQAHYAPWAADTPCLFGLRQNHPTWITRTAGVFTGFDEMDPEIMGNSDTGHQQIFNLCVARQIPAALSAMIDSGRFFANDELNADLARAARESTVVFKTLLSGEFGDDGYVHSAWRHMVAFFELYFEKLRLPASGLQVEAVLDGRDSPFYSSLQYEGKGGGLKYGFLRKLRKLLKKYEAEGCLAWILGRQFMDRDYKGAMIRKEYELVTANKGRRVPDFEAAIDLITADHAAGFTDPMIEPIVVGRPRPLGKEALLFNGIFRADRQEPICAALLGMKDFIHRQAMQKKRLDSWESFSWMTAETPIMWAMIDYHQDFPAAGLKCLIHDRPHEHNVLHLLNGKVPGFKFLFLTEGVKEKHMGLFSRGRRSTPLYPAEMQRIIPTCGKEEGIASDNDLHKVPAMRHYEIADELVGFLQQSEFSLVAANFPGADMIGHLIENHFEACVETIRSLDAVLRKIVPAALENGWVLALTSDHGNVEHYGPDHGNNDVLTTLLLPEGCPLHPIPPPEHTARLYDLSWTALAILGLSAEDLRPPPFPVGVEDDPRRLVGRSLLSRPTD